METDSERIMRSATIPSFRMVYKNSGIETQEFETVETLEHTLAINDKEPSQNRVLEDAVARPPLASQKPQATMP